MTDIFINDTAGTATPDTSTITITDSTYNLIFAHHNFGFESMTLRNVYSERTSGDNTIGDVIIYVPAITAILANVAAYCSYDDKAICLFAHAEQIGKITLFGCVAKSVDLTDTYADPNYTYVTNTSLGSIYKHQA